MRKVQWFSIQDTKNNTRGGDMLKLATVYTYDHVTLEIKKVVTFEDETTGGRGWDPTDLGFLPCCI